jgi:hypothetical protein
MHALTIAAQGRYLLTTEFPPTSCMCPVVVLTGLATALLAHATTASRRGPSARAALTTRRPVRAAARAAVGAAPMRAAMTLGTLGAAGATERA